MPLTNKCLPDCLADRPSDYADQLAPFPLPSGSGLEDSTIRELEARYGSLMSSADDGGLIVKVKIVHQHCAYIVTLDALDYYILDERGLASGWRLNKDCYGRLYPVRRKDKQIRTVASMILNPDERLNLRIFHHTDDRLNLRRRNLVARRIAQQIVSAPVLSTFSNSNSTNKS